MKLPFFALLKIILEGKSSTRFLIGVIFSFAFSIAVILSTIGLMDGFESTLVSSLQKSSGDLVLTNRDGFFHSRENLKSLKEFDYIQYIAPVTQVEAFAIANEQSKGMLVKGVEQESFQKVTGLNVSNLEEGVRVGKAFLESMSLNVGDELVLTFASHSKVNQGSPILKSFTISGVVDHGVFEKDMRYLYIDRKELLRTLNYADETTNLVLVKLKQSLSMEELKKLAIGMQSQLPLEFKVQTFWDDFKTLLEAVEVEKFSITIILQLIVVVAIFNIVAFVIFISEKKSQELFLLRAMGLSLKAVVHFWYRLLALIWVLSCLVSMALTYIFDMLLQNLSFFQLPGEIYVLSRLHIALDLVDFLMVFILSFVWVLLIGHVSLRKLQNKSLLHGLRLEFS
jgi:ABC-type lipoprotein release transport system permease subunit